MFVYWCLKWHFVDWSLNWIHAFSTKGSAVVFRIWLLAVNVIPSAWQNRGVEFKLWDVHLCMHLIAKQINQIQNLSIATKLQLPLWLSYRAFWFCGSVLPKHSASEMDKKGEYLLRTVFIANLKLSSGFGREEPPDVIVESYWTLGLLKHGGQYKGFAVLWWFGHNSTFLTVVGVNYDMV